MFVLECDRIRKLEEDAVRLGNTYSNLMEKAGTQATNFITKNLYKHIKNVTILCGSGNNGGDGFVIARHLSYHTNSITVILTKGLPKTEVALNMYKKILDIQNINIINYTEKDTNTIIQNSDLIVDAIFGIGFKGKIREEYNTLFDTINKCKAKKVSIDLPSGLICDAGNVEGNCIRADYTVTFSTLKPCQVLYPASNYCGDIIVKDVGIDKELISKTKYLIKTVKTDEISSFFTKRNNNSNKGSIGTLSTICGSYKMAGAAILSLKASLRSGIGLVKAILPRPIYPIVASSVPECVYLPLEESKDGTIKKECKTEILNTVNASQACLIGCGISVTEDTREIVYHLIRNAEVPLIIDADGINIISENINILKEAKSPIVLTPHPKEMSRLTNKEVKDIQIDRINVATNFVKDNNVTLVLKGANTIIASNNGEAILNITGNPGMAVGGSGDVLAGIIASFIAQKKSIYKSAVIGAYIHGLVGDIVSNKYSETYLLPSDIVRYLYVAFKQFEDEKFTS